jgi:hypothetical protein
MQFLILLTGVLVFVFYHFERPPLLWNAREMRRLEATLPPAELASLQAALTSRTPRGRPPPPSTRARAARRARGLPLRPRAHARRRTPGGPARVDALGQAVQRHQLHLPSVRALAAVGGLAGLVMAVIFAAAMSTLAGEFNSVATASMVDFYQRFVRTDGSATHYLWVSRLFTALWGGFACLVALQVGEYGSAIEVVNKFGSYFYGSILGVFLLAILARRLRREASFYGLIAGMITVVLVARFTTVFFRLAQRHRRRDRGSWRGSAITAAFPQRRAVV